MDSSNFERYLASIYWIVQTVITVGYGDMTPSNTLEQAISILAMFMGVIFFSLTIGTLTSLIAEIDTKNIIFEKKLNVLITIKKKYTISS